MTALQQEILRRLLDKRMIGGKHTAFENALGGIPKHLRGDAKDALEEFIKTGFVQAKPTHYGLQVSLNPDRLEEIKKIVNDEFEESN